MKKKISFNMLFGLLLLCNSIFLIVLFLMYGKAENFPLVPTLIVGGVFGGLFGVFLTEMVEEKILKFKLHYIKKIFNIKKWNKNNSDYLTLKEVLKDKGYKFSKYTYNNHILFESWKNSKYLIQIVYEKHSSEGKFFTQANIFEKGKLTEYIKTHHFESLGEFKNFFSKEIRENKLKKLKHE